MTVRKALSNNNNKNPDAEPAGRLRSGVDLWRIIVQIVNGCD
jgi:hypothetical protein